MFGKFQDNFRHNEIKPTDIEGPNSQHRMELPSVGDLKSKLEDIFTFKPQDGPELPSEIPDNTPLESHDSGRVTLEDGTVIELPDGFPDPNHETSIESNTLQPNSRYEINGKTYETDDTGKVCMVDNQFNPNDTFELNGKIYKTDDTGYFYMIDGKLESNITYELNGSIYKTDDNGRIISCKAKPERSPENPRDNEAQRDAGGVDRKEIDQGGHIVGRDLNGDGGTGNLVAMDSRINQSDYKRMENDVKSALDEGKEVTTETEISYTEDSGRPDKIEVTVTADGKETIYTFDNNLDGSLLKEVPENGMQDVQEEIKDTGGKISSIKEELDEDGNLTETTVNITYTDEDGNNHRTKVVISNNPGGED